MFALSVGSRSFMQKGYERLLHNKYFISTAYFGMMLVIKLGGANISGEISNSKNAQYIVYSKYTQALFIGFVPREWE